MIKSIHSIRGSKALEASKLPASFEAAGQSDMDRLHAILSGWDHSFVIGPSLHSSRSVLFVTRGTYQRMDACPKLAQKMIHRIICIVIKMACLCRIECLASRTQEDLHHQNENERQRPPPTRWPADDKLEFLEWRSPYGGMGPMGCRCDFFLSISKIWRGSLRGGRSRAVTK